MKSFSDYLESKFDNKIKCQCNCKGCKNNRCDLCTCKKCKEGKKCLGCNCDKKHLYKNIDPDPLKNSAKAELSSDENKPTKVRVVGDLKTTRRFI